MGRQNAEAQLNLPPGFRFYPTDEELVVHYLCRKAASQSLAVPIIAEVDLYKYDPWQLPDMALFGEKEWYFFTPRDRKYPNGSRPNRAAGSGYWKATGADKPITTKVGGRRVGIKKALVFYVGKAPKGTKTNWIMHEYRLADVSRPARKKGCLRLDDWVLCRIYNKKSSAEKFAKEQKDCFSHEAIESCLESCPAKIDEKDSEMMPTEITIMNSSIELSERTTEDSSKCDPSTNYRAGSDHDSRSPDITSNNHNLNAPFQQNLKTTNIISDPMDLPELNPLFNSMNNNNRSSYNTPLLLTDSSCSMPSSPELKPDKEEVQSRFRLAELMRQQENDLNQPMFTFSFDGLQSAFPQLDQMQAPLNNDPFQDYLASLSAPGYVQRPY